MRAQLEDTLNIRETSANPARYALSIVLTQSVSGLGVSREGIVGRYNIYLNTTYTLKRLGDQKVISTGKVNRVASYNNVVNAYFSAFQAERDARERAINELAEDYRLRLGAEFARMKSE